MRVPNWFLSMRVPNWFSWAIIPPWTDHPSNPGTNNPGVSETGAVEFILKAIKAGQGGEDKPPFHDLPDFGPKTGVFKFIIPGLKPFTKPIPDFGNFTPSITIKPDVERDPQGPITIPPITLPPGWPQIPTGPYRPIIKFDVEIRYGPNR